MSEEPSSSPVKRRGPVGPAAWRAVWRFVFVVAWAWAAAAVLMESAWWLAWVGLMVVAAAGLRVEREREPDDG